MPTPPRSRYAAVVSSAFVGAGLVALGAGSMPDAKTVNPSVLAELKNAAATSDEFAERSADAERASRDNERTELSTTLAEAEADAWLLPLEDYTFTAPFGVRWGELHPGIDLAAPEGTPYKAIHGGVVEDAKWMGGYGYAVVVRHADGTRTMYGHSSRLLVTKGQQVTAGDVLGEVGSTGFSYGAHLHIEVHVDGKPKDPIPVLREHGVDIKLQVEAPYSGVAG